MDWLHDSRHKKLDIKPHDLSSVSKVHIVEESQIPHAIVWSLYMLVSCACASMYIHAHTLMCTYKHTMHSSSDTHIHTN